MAITIIIDSREQRPLTFILPTVVGKLDTGDYSVEGLEKKIAIERKTINDLIGCLCNSRARFERELQRGMALKYFALVVEASMDDLVCGRFRSRMTPNSVIQSLLAFSVRYRLPIFFCTNRALACQVVESLLTRYAHEIETKLKILEERR